ncbi:hypothetical protein [Erythrobacter sp. WG]|uniref:hypothetical protein n=1 Tax=Erythrobacter sp. WG TaxID=2985510 RepID=UPI00226E2010|nr:hypothetical protein [Erythrobacter sp. WG]MCX9146305.1 hypothetical protein [Erythrobacter sp. WG]
MDIITFALALAAVSPATHEVTQSAEPPAPQGPTIIVTPPPTERERRGKLRDFTKQIIRSPRLRQPVAKFLHPVCVKVLGLAAPDAEAIAQRIRAHARDFGIGSDDNPDCIATVRVAFMAPEAGPPERWLSADSPSIAHLAGYQREQVLSEAGPVRGWNRVAVRDVNGRAFRVRLGDQLRFPEYAEVEAFNSSDPIVTTEITGAALLISREAAHGFTLAQLADYATVRTLVGTSAPSRDGSVPASTILSLFDDAEPPAEMTSFDRALVAELYNASRNSSARRAYNDIARSAAEAEAERATKSQNDTLDQ